MGFKIKNKERSFTLAEMLVVITMIMILIGIIIIGTEGSRALSRDKRRMADLAAYQVALQEYYSYYKSYPFSGKKKDGLPIDCADFKYNWTWDTEIGGCGAPQTQADCNDIEGCHSDDGKYCTCDGADEFLGRLKAPDPDGNAASFLDPLPKDPKADNTPYLYSFPLPNKGKSYKIAARLERDNQSMANDGGTDLTLYEVFSTLGASIAVDTSFFEGISSDLVCAVRNVGAVSCPNPNDCSCPGGTNEKMVLRLSNEFNAHAGLLSSTYPYAVCCSPPSISVGPGEIFLKLSAASNAHVGKISSAYAQNASFSSSIGEVQCGYSDVLNPSNPSACPKEEDKEVACLASISGDTNGHIASCTTNPYSTKVCCLIK